MQSHRFQAARVTTMSLSDNQSETQFEVMRSSKTQFWILAGAVVLVNIYAGGCAVHSLGPTEAAGTLATTPAFVFEFLLGGLDLYLVAAGIVGTVTVVHRLLIKRWLGVETFLIWSTAVNFALVALSGSGSM